MSMYDGYSKAGLIFGGTGGGGSDTAKELIVKATVNFDNTVTADKTYADIDDAYTSNKNIRIFATLNSPRRVVEFNSVIKQGTSYIFGTYENNAYLKITIAFNTSTFSKATSQNLVAGDNITIENNRISSNQPTAPNPYKLTYTSGNGTEAYDGSVPKMITLEKLNGASKDFVNSSIATNTAFFKGTFDVKEDLGFENYEVSDGDIVSKLNSISCEKGEVPKEGDKILDVTNNDYLFVSDKDSSGNVIYIRYKYNKDQSSTWMREYILNNSSFTAEQWATIQSGITEDDVTQIETNRNAIAELDANMPDSPEDVDAQPKSLIIESEFYGDSIGITDERYIDDGMVNYSKLYEDSMTAFNNRTDVVLRLTIKIDESDEPDEPDEPDTVVDLKCNCFNGVDLLFEGHNVSAVIVVTMASSSVEVSAMYDIEAVDHIEDHEYLDDYLTTAGAQKDYFQKKIIPADDIENANDTDLTTAKAQKDYFQTKIDSNNKLPANYVSDIVKTTGASQQKIVANGSTATDTPLVLRSSSNKTEGFIGFENGEGKSLGYLGVDSNKKPVFFDSANHELAFKSDIPTVPSNIVKGYDSSGVATAFEIRISSSEPPSGTSNTIITLVTG